jgi:hypothetical protein
MTLQLPLQITNTVRVHIRNLPWAERRLKEAKTAEEQAALEFKRARAAGEKPDVLREKKERAENIARFRAQLEGGLEEAKRHECNYVAFIKDEYNREYVLPVCHFKATGAMETSIMRETDTPYCASLLSTFRGRCVLDSQYILTCTR